MRWIGRGTHTGELMGVPSTVRIDRLRRADDLPQHIADGKIAEEWTVWDALGLLQQVGAVAPA